MNCLFISPMKISMIVWKVDISLKTLSAIASGKELTAKISMYIIRLL